MVRWVPSCMLLWGISTALHTWVRARWQLYTLRILIGCLEGGLFLPLDAITARLIGRAQVELLDKPEHD